MRDNQPVTQREYPFPSTSAIVSTTDLRGQITYCNDTFVEVSGFERHELMGQPQNILRHPDMPCEAFRDLWATVKSRRPWSAVVKNRRKNGDHYWVRANVTPVLARGKVVGYLSVRTCPTREEVRDAEALYRDMRAREVAGRRLSLGLSGGVVVRQHRLARAARALWQSSHARVAALVLPIAALPPLPSLLELWPSHHALATLLGVGLATVVGTVLLRRQLSAPLQAFTTRAHVMAAGDLGQVPADDGDGATGHLARALNQLNVNLRAVVADVRLEIAGVDEAAGRMARGAADLSSRTESQAASLEQAAASMEEFTSALQQARERADEAQGVADAAMHTAREGTRSIDSLDATMQAIEKAVNDIGEVTELVDGLAFQTNILALNASVEAARAGEHGAGFAVVAGEVRDLAQRSARAARDIHGLVETSRQRMADGGKAVHGSGRHMQAIVDAVGRMRDLVAEIAAGSAEQADGVNQLNDMIAQLDSVTQRNAALVAESTGAAQVLRDKAGLLQQSVGVFRLESGMASDEPVAFPTPSRSVQHEARTLPRRRAA